jgi:hypothetical protein
MDAYAERRNGSTGRTGQIARYPDRPVDQSTPQPTPSQRPARRPRRFHLPHDHHDARASERIEAFLEGPPRPSRRRRPIGAQRRGTGRPITLDSVGEWRSALRQESVRAERYGRPGTVLVVDVAAEPAALTPIELVGPVLDAIRHEARETDRAVRVSPTRFHVLLPETGEHDAARFAERLREASRNRLNGHGGVLRLRHEAHTAGQGGTLEDALDAAERRLDY